jgi:hypothetical protein
MSQFVTVEFDLIPEIFHASHVFQSRVQMINSKQILLQQNVCNFNLRMNNYTELCRALDTLRYWNFEKTPECFYTSVLSKKHTIREIVISNEYNLLMRFQTFRIFAELCVLVISNNYEKQRVAARLGLTQLVDFLSRND